jgi:hypothetical protein
MSSKRVFLIILLVYLALAVAYSVVEPLGEAPDEADHYAYLRYIGLNRHLPEGPTVTQSKHPPLYHIAAAALTGWTGLDFSFLRSNPDALPLGPDRPPNFFIHTTLEDFPWQGGALAMHLARFLSVLLGAIILWSTWQLGQEVFPDRPEVGLLAAAFLAGLPGFLFISGAIGNDTAAGAFGALALLLCARTLTRGLALRRSVALGLVLGLGLLSKVGTLALWPLAAIAAAGAWWLAPATPGRPAPVSWRERLAAGRLASPLGHLALAWGLGLLVASPWYLRNWRLYGDPFGWSLVRATVDQRLAPLTLADLRWLLWGLYRTFWGRFGGAGQVELPGWAYILAGLACLALLAGIVRFLARRRSGGGTQALAAAPPRSTLLLLILALAPVLVLVTLWRYSAIALGTDQARLLWPALAAMAVWAGVGVAGLADWVTGRRREQPTTMTAAGVPSQDTAGLPGAPRLVLGFTAGMAAIGLVVLLGVIRPAFAPPQPVAPAGSQAGEMLARFGPLELVGVELSDGPLAPGQAAAVRLLWRAGAPMDSDLRPVVRLVHSDGWLAAEWSHSPAGGRYATDRWQVGEVIADDYQLLPESASPGTYRLAVAVRPFGGDWILPQGNLERLPVDAESTVEPFVVVGQVVYR